MKKVQNFFLTDFYLKKFTQGSTYLTVPDFDVAVTKNENVFIKVPSHFDFSNSNLIKERTDKIVQYLDEEGFLPKMKQKKQVHVWVYN